MRPDAGRPSVTFTRPVTRQICTIAAIKDDCSRTIESARNNYALRTRADHNPRRSFDRRWNCSRKNRGEEVVGLKCKRAKREEGSWSGRGFDISAVGISVARNSACRGAK